MTALISAGRAGGTLALALAIALPSGPALAGVVPPPMEPQSHEITAPGPQGPLAGTLLQPWQEDAPVVLILPGSGPTDRDGNNPLGVKAASYRYLAEALAARGIASVRIDKRGMFASRNAVANADAVTMDDYAADTRAWIGAARQATGAKCVWLLGHSEGGLVALAAAAQDDAGICGLALLAAPGRPLQDVIREQLRANPANGFLLADADRIIDALVAGETVPDAAIPAPLLPLFRESVQGFVRSAFALDPARLAQATDLPLLLVYGGRDIQTPPADGERLAQARPDARLFTLPTMNHVLKPVAGEGRTANLATYADPDLPLADGLAIAIAGFVKEGGRP